MTMATVTSLTREGLNSLFEQDRLSLVAYILPFIPGSARFLAEYEAAAVALHSSDISLATVDCQKEQGFGPFNRWPNVKLYKGQEIIEQYEGPWKTLIAWTKRLLRPAISDIDMEQLRDLQLDGQIVIVGCFGVADDEHRQRFATIAEDLRADYVFGFDANGSIARLEKIATPNIIIFKHFDEKITTVEHSSNEVELKARIRGVCEPLIFELRPEVHRRLEDTGLPIAYTLTDGTAEQCIEVRKMLEPVAQRYHDRIIFGIADTLTWSSLADDLHLNAQTLPNFGVRDMQKGRFPLHQHQQCTIEIIESFLRRFVDGELIPTVKSEPVPDDQDGPVTVVVGLSYNDVVIDNDKDVLLDYYTQWCGPCKAMYPIYEALARLYSSNSIARQLVVIAKVDAEANDVPGDIRGFPTFKLFPAGSKEEPVHYDGPRQ